jgi:hypothetical protein
MGFGYTVTSGSDNKPLSEDLMRWVAEVRVEQDLSKPTAYAVRFEEDLCEGEPATLKANEVQPGEVLSVIVQTEDDKKICLVRGPVTKIKSSAVTGGPGSWLEVHGEDRRVEMDREAVQAAWEGKGSDIVESILGRYSFEADTCETEIVYDKKKKTLNQSGSDLKFVEDLARRNGFEFWITYDVEAPGGLPGLGPSGSWRSEPAHFKPSPPRPSGSPLSLPVSLDSLLASPDTPALRIHVPADECPNVTAFKLDVDVERATAAAIVVLDEASGKVEESEASDKQPESDPGSLKLADIKGVTRTIIQPGAGDAAEQQIEHEAVLTDEGWFVTATASTSSHMLPGVAAAHDIVKVEGIGLMHTGNYQVSKVTHVINFWGHLMDLMLRRNALPEKFNG